MLSSSVLYTTSRYAEGSILVHQEYMKARHEWLVKTSVTCIRVNKLTKYVTCSTPSLCHMKKC